MVEDYCQVNLDLVLVHMSAGLSILSKKFHSNQCVAICFGKMTQVQFPIAPPILKGRIFIRPFFFPAKRQIWRGSGDLPFEHAYLFLAILCGFFISLLAILSASLLNIQEAQSSFYAGLRAAGLHLQLLGGKRPRPR